MTVTGWRAWYTGDRIFTSAASTWANLPGAGLLFVMLYFVEQTRGGRRYRQAIYGNDHYWQDPDGTFQQSDVKPAGTRTKLGTLIPDAEFEALVVTAFASRWPI